MKLIRSPACSLLRALAFVILGLTINILVAWYAALCEPALWGALSTQTPNPPWPGPHPQGWPPPLHDERWSGPLLSGVRAAAREGDALMAVSPDAAGPTVHQTHLWRYELYSAGWPWRSLSWRWLSETVSERSPRASQSADRVRVSVRHFTYTGLPPPASAAAWSQTGRRLPTTPMWPGLIAGSFFYGLIIYLPVHAIPALRRTRRVRRGLCPACGYNRSGLPAESPCPECGSTIPVPTLTRPPSATLSTPRTSPAGPAQSRPRPSPSRR